MSSGTVPGSTGTCHICKKMYDCEQEEVMRTSETEYYHMACFVCQQCFQPFGDEEFFTDTSEPPKLYCKNDYWKLMGPRCAGCNEDVYDEFIIGFDLKWHYGCFKCCHCSGNLEVMEAAKKSELPLCQKCFEVLGSTSKVKLRCQWRGPHKATKINKCGKTIDKFILYTDINEGYSKAKICPDHLSCFECSTRLDEFGRQKYGQYYCHLCYDTIGTRSTCAMCRQVIMERPLEALGKAYHPQHFLCTDCQIPLSGEAYYEYNQQAYCLEHYKSHASDRCFVCSNVPTGTQKYTQYNKTWCVDHWSCAFCFAPIDKYMPFDMKPLCLDCYRLIPDDTLELIKTLNENEKKFEKQLQKRKAIA